MAWFWQGHITEVTISLVAGEEDSTLISGREDNLGLFRFVVPLQAVQHTRGRGEPKRWRVCVADRHNPSVQCYSAPFSVLGAFRDSAAGVAAPP